MVEKSRVANVFGKFFGGKKATISETSEISENSEDLTYTKADIAPKAKRISKNFVQQSNALSKMLHDIEAAEKSLASREIEVRSSNEQMKGFKSFVRKAEIELHNSVRLSNERQDLNEQVVRFSQDNTELKSKLEDERSKLAAANTANEKIRIGLENAREDIIRLMERDSDFREEIEAMTSDLSKTDAERVRLSSESENLRAENQVLSERSERSQVEIENYEQRLSELQKSYDVVSGEQKIILERQEQSSAEASAAVKSLETYQIENAELRSQVNNGRLESDSLKRQYEEKIRIREEELFSLRANLSTLQSEARVKEQVLHQSQDNLSIARTEVKASKDITQQLRIATEKEKDKADQYRSQVSDLHTQMSVMSVKYDAVLVELEDARKENERLARVLKLESQKMEFVFDSSISEHRPDELVAENSNGSKERGKPH